MNRSPGPVADGFRHTIRGVYRDRFVSAGIVFLIAIGIGANTFVFTFVNAFMWRNLPIRRPESLVQFFEKYPDIRPQTYFEYGFYQRVAEQSSTLLDVIGQSEFTVALEKSSEPERIYAVGVTDNFFTGLGVPPVVGRVFAQGDDHIAVLSHNAWVSRFAKDPAVIGQSIRLGGSSYRIVGVAPDGFTGTNIDAAPDLWFPLKNAEDFFDRTSRRSSQLYTEIVARLRPEISLNRAQQETEALWNQFSEESIAISPNPDLERRRRRDIRFEIESISRGVSAVRDEFRTAMTALWAGTGLLMLIVCANAGGLLLARATAHEKETAVRLALGSRPAAYRQSMVLR
jgi:MacB-like periplasmic core domain